MAGRIAGRRKLTSTMSLVTSVYGNILPYPLPQLLLNCFQGSIPHWYWNSIEPVDSSIPKACFCQARVSSKWLSKSNLAKCGISRTIGVLGGDRLAQWRWLSWLDGLVGLQYSVVVDQLPDGQPPQPVQQLLLRPPFTKKFKDCPCCSELLYL